MRIVGTARVPDVKQAFHQLQIAENSQELFTLNTHKGLFWYRRLPFGYSRAPAEWQATIDKILTGLPSQACFMDDVIVCGKTAKDLIKNVEGVLKRFQEFGVKVNKEKCEFLKPEIECLGHLFTGKGVQMNPSKIEAVKNMRQPTNVEEVRSFVGFVNYYRDNVNDMATVLVPITRLLRKENKLQ